MRLLINLLRLTVLTVGVMWLLTMQTPSVHAQLQNCSKFNTESGNPCVSCCNGGSEQMDLTDGTSEGAGIQELSSVQVNCGTSTSCPGPNPSSYCGSRSYQTAVNSASCCLPSGFACNQGTCCSPYMCLSNKTCGYCRSSGQSCGANSDCCNGNCVSGMCATACPQSVPPSCPCSPHGLPIDNCSYSGNHGCPGGYAPAQGVCCCSGSPVVISLIEDAQSNAEAFPMTTLSDGIRFAITTNPEWIYPVSWTKKDVQVAFAVHLPSDYVPRQSYTFNGGDLFGNFAPQPPSTKDRPANGYAALLVWDQPENGGNADGQISMADRAVQRGIAPGGIVLWIDGNHDGTAQPDEVYTFQEKGVRSIAAGEYRRSDWIDSAGNSFRFAAPVHLLNGKRTKSFDVFLVLGESK